MSNKVYTPNKTEDLNLSVFNRITGINESKTLKHISCKCKFDGRKCNSDQKSNSDKCWCECRKHCICEKDYIWNPAICSYKHCKYLASIIDDSVMSVMKLYTPKLSRLMKKHILMKKCNM